MPRITGIAPFFRVADVVRAAEYYRDKLGFAIQGYFLGEPPVFAMVGRDDQIIMRSLMTAARGGSNLRHERTEVRDLDGCVICSGEDVPGP